MRRPVSASPLRGRSRARWVATAFAAGSREALRLGGALGAKPGRDYVFVARPVSLSAPFAELLAQMTEGLARLNDRGAARPRRKQEDRLTRP